MSENVFRFVLFVVFVPQCVVSLMCIRSARAASSLFRHREEGIALSVLLGAFYLAYCCGILAYLIEPRGMAWGSAAGLPAWSRWIGVGPLVMGVILIIWGLGALRTNFAFSVSPQEGSKLVTTGPYRWMRHPLYTAFLIEAAGISVVMASWFVGLMAALVWGLLVYRTRIEEEKLIERYGNQYRLYMESAGRFFPRLTR